MKTNKSTKNTAFKKGVSGNPAGRPPGSRNKSTLALEQILEDEAEQITRKAIELAKDGNIAALRLCMTAASQFAGSEPSKWNSGPSSKPVIFLPPSRTSWAPSPRE
jgi:hypothetical protein